MQLIIKKKDGGVRIVVPNSDKFGPGKRPYSELKIIAEAESEGLDWFEYDEKIDKSDLESRRQLMWERDGGKDKVIKDMGWERRLMPDSLIRRKHLARIKRKLDVELAQDRPDPIKALKLQHEFDRVKEIPVGPYNNSLPILEMALNNMDEDSLDKPVIRQKLQAAISELKTKGNKKN